MIDPTFSSITVVVLQMLQYRLEVISRVSKLRWVFDKTVEEKTSM